MAAGGWKIQILLKQVETHRALEMASSLFPKVRSEQSQMLLGANRCYKRKEFYSLKHLGDAKFI